MALLDVDGLSIDYTVAGRVHRAAQDVSFTLGQGETLALVGQSGSGKSTIARSIIGLLPAAARVESGSIDFDGTQLLGIGRRELRELRGRRIGYVPQDPQGSLNPVRTIGAQLREVLRVHGHAEVDATVLDSLDAVGIHHPERVVDLYPHELSGGMLQRVLIAGAISLRPRLLLADEPTSALDVTVQKRILDLLDELRTEYGFGVLLITHDLALASERSDAVVVLKEGVVQETGPVEQVLLEPESEYARELLADAPGSGRIATRERLPERPVEPGPVPLEVRDVTKTFRSRGGAPAVVALSGVSFALARGTTHALVGESGSGKSTLARIIARLAPQSSGQVLIDGRVVDETRHARVREVRRTFQLVYQSPFDALDTRQTVASILREPLDRYRIGDAASRRIRVRELADSVALPERLLGHRAAELSGGQLQRVAIGRALALDPETLILDEPTSALDVTVQATVLRLLVKLQDELGLSYLFISHDLDVVRALSDTVTVLRHGEVVEDGLVDDVLSHPAEHYTRSLIASAPRLPLRPTPLTISA